ncbi:hypothetical protein [Microbulbifer yueqingensis]|uniref:Uncharacterized protein n=1 Tax=Microbulbifer yueqingensis TaxID=658219 RepID=A0A1G8XUX3_9GAMM|nr:hypothetical protein [Microbulbifer yueqingensis]SDJ94379.1 hypothetical protein SAMN05216212_1251 [Microbulbifer yueqingensis]
MNNHHWLMNAQVLTLMRKLRKRLQAEFDINLRLSEDGLEQHLAKAKYSTVDGETRRLIAEIEHHRGAPFLTGEEPRPRLYRGQPVLRENTGKDIYAMIYGEELSLHDPALRGRSRPEKMYRGQKVLQDDSRR